MFKIKLNPLTERKLKRFRRIRRGYYSFLLLTVIFVLTLLGELLINSRALVVKYDGHFYFPTYSAVRLGKDFGLTGDNAQIPVNYRDLQKKFERDHNGNWVIMPPIPYDPYENLSYQGVFKAAPPSWSTLHLLGTDTSGRDILARLFYGIRVAIIFALVFLVMTYLVGITIGCLMGYFGGAFDLSMQRVVEIWSNIPFLYTVIIIYSVVPSTLSITMRVTILLVALVVFSWIPMTYYMRTATYREKARDYISAAVVMGAGTPRIIFSHIIPNTISTIVTFMPFTVVSAITSITALDFLGFGLPPPTPSIGELLQQGVSNLSNAPWIIISAFATLVIVLTLFTFVGEAVREAFDPRKFTFYR